MNSCSRSVTSSSLYSLQLTLGQFSRVDQCSHKVYYKLATLLSRKEGFETFDGRAKLSDGRAIALPCPPLATPMPLVKLILASYS